MQLGTLVAVSATFDTRFLGDPMLRFLASATAAAMLLAPGCAALAQGSPVTVKLSQQNKSGESGTATITPQGNKTQVVLQLSGAPAGTAQPAHIHAGSCSKLDPKPKIPLQNVTDGKSTTMLDMPMEQVVGSGGAINVHKSAEDLKTYVACGDLKASK
jgi:hypothetical protein